MKNLLLTLIAAVSFISHAGAIPQPLDSQSSRILPSSRMDVVPAMQVNHLGNYRGQYLHVLYVISYNPFIATTVEQTIVKSIRLSAKPVKIETDSINIASVSIEKQGISGSYNNILMVISKDENFSWKNSDLSMIENYQDTGAHQKSLVKSVKYTQVEAYMKLGLTQPMQISILD